MHLVFDIFQGIGVAAALGVRPFLPGLAAGALAAGDIQIGFKHTNFSYLQSAPFLLALALAAIAFALLERRLGAARLETRPALTALVPVVATLGALFFAASLCRGHYAIWPGLVGGAVCALIAIAATRPLLARVRSRLDGTTAGALALYAEAAAVALAALSIVAPPVGPIGLAGLIWILIAGRRRDGQKYAGLRILR